MPHRREVQKGSFGGHFDELLELFRNERAKPARKCRQPKTDPHNIHDRLFEGALQPERARTPRVPR